MKFKRPELGRVAVALFLSIALWLVVSAEEPTAAWVPIRLVLTVDTSVSIVSNAPEVRAFVVGSRRDLFKLVSTRATIQRAITEDDRDSVRIELREQDVDMPTGTGLTVRDVRPRILTLKLRRHRDTSSVADSVARDSVVHDSVAVPLVR